MINILQNEEIVNLNDYFCDDSEIIDGKIYKITNLITGKIYIGQTIKSIEQRWKGHVKNSKYGKPSQYIHKSMKIHGIENFTIEIIDSAKTYMELNQREYEWVIKEDCIAPKGYNLKNGGGNRGGYSEETRRKIGLSNKGKTLGIPLTEETKIKIGLANGGDKNGFYGKNHSPEMILQMSKSHCGHTVTNETRQKIGLANKGKRLGCKMSDKTCQQMSAYRYGKKWYHNLELNQEILIDVELGIPDNFIPGRLPMTDEEKRIKTERQLNTLADKRKTKI